MNYYHLHLVTLDGSITSYSSINSTGTQLVPSGLMLDEWPRDDIFIELGYFFVTERLRSLLTYKQFSGLKFSKIAHLEKGGGFLDKYPDAEIPEFYWLMEVTGSAGKDDFGLFDYHNMVVSQKALYFLRDNLVTHAEADEITTITLKEYFDSPRKYFWMDESMRRYFIEMDNLRNKTM